MEESEEELKNLLMKVKEESVKAGLKLNLQKVKIMASGPTTSWQINGETMETVIIFLGSKIIANDDFSHEIKRLLLLGRNANTGVGCHFLLQCVKMKSESEVVQSCLTQRPHIKTSKFYIIIPD